MTAPFEINTQTRRVICNPRNLSFVQNPYQLYQGLYEKSPRFFWEDYGHWCFAGWDDVSTLLRDRRFGRQILHVATREELGMPEPKPHLQDFDRVEAHSLLGLEPPEHTRLRLLVNRAFVSRQVENLRPKIHALANELVDTMLEQGDAELIKDFAAPLPVFIIAEMLGIPTQMGPQLLNWSNRIVQMYMFTPTEQTEHDANTAALEFSDYLRGVIAEKRVNPGIDLISHMLTTDARGHALTEDELVSTAILLLNAGHEATVHQAGNAVKTILESRQPPADLFATPQSTEAVVEECLRYDAPLHMFTRYALSEIDLGDGIVLKQGDEIGLLLASANRDPKQFSHANQFMPERTDGANVSFGAGIHFCIGAPLARIELQTALSVLFTRIPTLKLTEQPTYSDKYHFHGLDTLHVGWR